MATPSPFLEKVEVASPSHSLEKVEVESTSHSLKVGGGVLNRGGVGVVAISFKKAKREVVVASPSRSLWKV